jgi:hypothetical protein
VLVFEVRKGYSLINNIDQGGGGSIVDLHNE